MGRSELVQDERFSINARRVANVKALDDIIRAWSRQHNAAEMGLVALGELYGLVGPRSGAGTDGLVRLDPIRVCRSVHCLKPPTKLNCFLLRTEMRSVETISLSQFPPSWLRAFRAF